MYTALDMRRALNFFTVLHLRSMEVLYLENLLLAEEYNLKVTDILTTESLSGEWKLADRGSGGQCTC